MGFLGRVCIYLYNNHYKKNHSHQISFAFNGPVSDEYQPDKNKENWLFSNLTISITIAPAKLQNGVFSSFRDIYRIPLHIISEQTVDGPWAE